jgi:type IV secretory pathway VirB4 component
LIGIGFTLFDFETKISDRLRFLTGFRLGGLSDKKVREFIEVKRIERNTIFLKNGELRAILQVKPVNFELMDDSQKNSLILNYREFLNHLTFPIQIVIRTVNSAKPDYSFQDLRIHNLSNDKLKELYKEFRIFEAKFIEDNSIKERLYYIVVPLENKRTMMNKEIKDDDQIKELNLRVQIIQERLGHCNLFSFRLGNSQLISLMMSYFENYIEIGDDYLSRITVYNRFNTQKEVV